MANAINTLAGLINFNDANVDGIEVSDLLQDTPLLARLYAKAASNGTLHKYLKETVASSAAFRAVNAGLTKTFSQDELITDTLKLLDASFDIDKGLLIGAITENILAKELARSVRAAFVGLEKQIIYGTTALGASAGFSGLMNQTTLDALADSMVIEPHGTAGTTADSQTSVFLIRTSDSDLSVIIGNDGQLTVGDPYDIRKVADVDVSNAAYSATAVDVLGYGGLQYGSIYSVARIANIETTFDDDDIYEALSLFPSAKQPNVIAMNRKALKLLRASRTATNATGAPAGVPMDVEGIEIVSTDTIVSTEPVEV